MIDREINPKDLNSEELDERYRNTWHSAVGNFKFDAEASLLSIEMNRRFMEESEQIFRVRSKTFLKVRSFPAYHTQIS